MPEDAVNPDEGTDAAEETMRRPVAETIPDAGHGPGGTLQDSLFGAALGPLAGI